MNESPEARVATGSLEDPAGVLLVDDIAANLVALRSILEGLDLRLVDAHSAEEAIERAKAEEFAAILLDVRMPGLNGFDAARAIRANRHSQATPVIFLTADDVDRQQIETGYALGAVDFLVKPLSPIAVQAKVSALVRLFEEKQRAKHEAEQLRLLVHSTTDYAIFMLDPQGRVATWNTGAERLKGYQADEIIGQHFSKFYPKEAIERGWPAHELTVAAAEGRFEDEGWRLRKDGSPFWANVVITALKDEQGRLRGFSKITRDLTARKQSEENARRLAEETAARRVAEQDARLISEQREKLQVTLASIGDAVISTDDQGRVTFLNPAAERLVGWNTLDAAGRALDEVFQIVNENTRQPVENPARRALRDGHVVGLANHTILISKEGTERPIDDSAAPIKDAEGNVIGSVLVFRDISERRRAEQTARFLADASAALAVLVDFDSTLQKVAALAVPYFADWAAIDVLEADGGLRRVAVAHVDPAKVELAHEAYRRFPPNPASRTGPWSILHTGQPETVPIITDELLARSIADEELLGMMRRLGLKSYIGVPLTVRNKTLGVLTFVAAESGHVYDETDLRVAKDLADRTAIAIENSQLYRELQDADRRKDEFLATLAHELRNPLAPIRNGLQVLRLAGSNGEMVGEARTMMERQLGQMVRLVDDLLDVSRITRNRLELRKERVALATVVHSAIETSRPLIEQFGHTFSVTPAPAAVYLDADPVRLAQVFSNLLNNSAKYTEPGGKILLTVETDGTEAVIRVRDTGLGIPAEALPRIFEMFSQVDRTMERAEGGLGIGLTLVRRLTEMHGGKVEARSEGPGRGSEFTVRLPVLSDLPAPSERAAAGPGSERELKRRILVVDDNRDSATSLGLMLKLMGNEVHTAYDGLAAFEAAEEFRPDFILLDIGLPKLNGYDTCRRIREQPWARDMIIVALTGWGQEEDRRRSQDAGFNHHLVKPVDVAVLRMLIAQAPVPSPSGRELG